MVYPIVLQRPTGTRRREYFAFSQQDYRLTLDEFVQVLDRCDEWVVAATLHHYHTVDVATQQRVMREWQDRLNNPAIRTQRTVDTEVALRYAPAHMQKEHGWALLSCRATSLVVKIARDSYLLDLSYGRVMAVFAFDPIHQVRVGQKLHTLTIPGDHPVLELFVQEHTPLD
jgi:hypothetical protein